ncbi:MAG: cytochrome c1 [Cytophagales bacterium]|nr:cytochrome c1 [Cytophagales bacterium]
MKKLFALLLSLGLAFGSVSSFANDGGIAWDKAPNKTNDQVALQNGAKLFVNYCLNCHSAAFMRYNRMTEIGLTEKQIKENLLFGSAKVGETMKSAIDPLQAKEWFGGNPPDLSVMARSRSDGSKGSGADYLYTYLRSYYRDETKPTGWNNHVFPSVGMPHVLWELQASMKPAEYDQAVGDLVGFMQWMAEPAQNKRIQVGVWVLFFMLTFSLIAWRLNAAYWKDVK